MTTSAYTPSLSTHQPHQGFILAERIERSSFTDWIMPACFTAFWLIGLSATLVTAKKIDYRLLTFAILVGLGSIFYLLRKINVIGLLAFKRRAELVFPFPAIKAGDDIEILFRQDLKRMYTVKSVDATLLGRIIDSVDYEKHGAFVYMRRLSPDKFLQQSKRLEARRTINLPEHLSLPSEYENLPIRWQILVSVKLRVGSKCLSVFDLPH